jgi:hypothetical protein
MRALKLVLPAPVIFVSWLVAQGCGGDGANTAPDPDGGLPDGTMAGDGNAQDAPLADGSMSIPEGPSVLQFHKHASRDGVYVDALITKAKAATIHKDPTFQATIAGHVFSQVLYAENGPGGKEAVFVATESNDVYALDASTGAQLWMTKLGPEMIDHPSFTGCGNLLPLGVTSTPIIDLAARRMYIGAVIASAGGVAPMFQKVFALSLDDGKPVTGGGWPVNLETAVPGFQSQYQSQRGALALMKDTLYIPYGGYVGDCGPYRGRVVGVSTATGTVANNYVTAAAISGIWSPGGLASDGTNIYATSGNAPGGTATWGGQEAVLRFQAGPTFSNTAVNYFAPSNWQEMDTTDKDMCGAGPVLLDVPGATPSKLVLGMSKEGVAHVLDRNNLGGIGTGDGGTGEGLVSRLVIGGEIHTAAATYTTRLGTYVVLNGDTGGIDCPGATAGSLVAIKITATAPPKIEVAWCATPPGPGAPMVTTTDGQNETLVWLSGSSKLQAFDGDTGARVFQGGGAAEAMGNVRHWVPPIAAKGRVLIAGDGAVYAFTVK